MLCCWVPTRGLLSARIGSSVGVLSFGVVSALPYVFPLYGFLTSSPSRKCANCGHSVWACNIFRQTEKIPRRSATRDRERRFSPDPMRGSLETDLSADRTSIRAGGVMVEDEVFPIATWEKRITAQSSESTNGVCLVHGVAGRQRAFYAVESQRLQRARELALVNRFPNRSHSAIERNS